MRMARASHQIIDELEKYSKQSDVQGLLVPAHVYLCDVLVLRYHQSAIINAIRSKMGTIPKSRRESKHFTVGYWFPIIENMFSKQDAPKRGLDGIIYGEMTDYNGFNHIITKLVLTDYSINDALLINNIVNTYTIIDIIAACNIALSNNANSASYINVVLQNEKAKQQVKSDKIDALGARIQSSDRLLDKEIHTHTPIELAQMQYQYTKKQENAILQALVDKLLGDKK